MTRRAQGGMTLIEVLVAMAILASVAGSVLVMTGQNARFIAASENRFLARIVADNAMVEALAVEVPLEQGLKQETTDLGGRRWDIQRTVIDLGQNNLIRIDIAVSLTGADQVMARATTLEAVEDLQ